MQSLTTAWTGAAFPVTPTQIVNIISHYGYTPHIVPRFKLLDGSLNPVPTGVRGPYGDDGDITSYVLGAVVTNDGTLNTDGTPKTPIQRTLDLTLREDVGLVYDPLVHLIQPFVDYFDSSGNLYFEVPMGVFRFNIPQKTVTDATITSQATLLDLTSRVSTVGFLNTYTVAASQPYTTAAQSILAMSPLPIGFGGTGQTPAGLADSGPGLTNFDLTRVAGTIPNITAPIPYTRKDGKLTAVNQLNAAVGLYPLWFDELGNAVFQSRPNLSVSVPATTWSYHTDVKSIILPPVSWQVTNLADLANIVAVYVENNNAASFSSLKVNDNNTLSSLCISRLGYAIHKIISDSNIPDQANCDLRAYIALTNSALVATQFTFTTPLNPFHQTHDYLDVVITDKNGATLISSPTGFEEMGWKADLFARTMEHTVGRLLVL